MSAWPRCGSANVKGCPIDVGRNGPSHDHAYRSSLRSPQDGRARRAGDVSHRRRSRPGDLARASACHSGGRRRRGRARHALKKTLEMVRAFRQGDDETPLVRMGYYNPIYIYGVDRFLRDAKAAGVDGLIVVDLPPEEDEELCLPALKAGVNFIRLATPTTDDK